MCLSVAKLSKLQQNKLFKATKQKKTANHATASRKEDDDRIVQSTTMSISVAKPTIKCYSLIQTKPSENEKKALFWFKD